MNSLPPITKGRVGERLFSLLYKERVRERFLNNYDS